jgi:tRNA G18 (ribose-2'-O)-methylase SpoU
LYNGAEKQSRISPAIHPPEELTMEANIHHLTDLSHPGLEPYARLTEAQLRARREAQGVFIAESAVVISHALEAGCEPLSLLMEERQLTGQGAELMARCPEVPVYTAPREVLAQLTGYALTRGILCALRRPVLPTAEEVCQGAHRIAVLENIIDATNVGAIFRSAAALGVDGVLLSPSCADPLLRRAARVSMGTAFQVPWTRLGRKKEWWPEAGISKLRELGFRTAALALSENAVSIESPELAAEERLAVFLGTEGTGLLEKTIELCDYNVIIPMSHGVDSLNVAAASAVAFWCLRGPGALPLDPGKGRGPLQPEAPDGEIR